MDHGNAAAQQAGASAARGQAVPARSALQVHDWPASPSLQRQMEQQMDRLQHLYLLIDDFVVQMKVRLDVLGNSARLPGSPAAPLMAYLDRMVHNDLVMVEGLQLTLRNHYQILLHGPPARRDPAQQRMTFAQLRTRAEQIGREVDHVVEQMGERIRHCPIPEGLFGAPNHLLEYLLQECRYRYAQDAARLDGGSDSAQGSDSSRALYHTPTESLQPVYHAAEASQTGHPAGITNHVRAYDSGWATQARLFALGTPVAGNAHLRRYVFEDGSRVEIQAHTPMVQRDSFLLSIINPWAMRSAYAWQGYSAEYFRAPQDATAWGRQYFYGVTPVQNRRDVIRVDGQTDPSTMPDFALQASEFHWHPWYFGSAAARVCPTHDTTADDHNTAQSPALRHTELLVQGMTTWEDATSGLQAYVAPQPTHQALLVASH